MLRDRFAARAIRRRADRARPAGGRRRYRAAPPDGLLLAGDAAGFVDPMTGDGLRFAVRGGELAAAAALEALEHGWDGVQARLARARRREFSAKWRFNRALRRLVGSPAAVHLATWGARIVPSVVRSVIATRAIASSRGRRGRVSSRPNTRARFVSRCEPARHAALVFGLMLIEAQRAARNERAQRSRGGIEPPGDVYRLMQIAYPGIFAAMIAEGALARRRAADDVFAGRPRGVRGREGAQMVGDRLARSALDVPRDRRARERRRLRRGRTAIMRHPNYVAVVGEIVGVALMTGARVTGPLALVVFGALLARRIAVENRALDAILRRELRRRDALPFPHVLSALSI